MPHPRRSLSQIAQQSRQHAQSKLSSRAVGLVVEVMKPDHEPDHETVSRS